MLDLLGSAILIIIGALLVWAGLRAWRTTNPLIKWGGIGLTAFLSPAISLIGVIAVVGLFKVHARSAPATELKVVGTSEQIQRGRAISDGFCSACHSKTGTLTGGLDIGEHFPVPIGSFVSANLTPAGQLSRWSDADIFRAIRNSIDRDGRWLIIMSYTNAGKLSDDDIAAVIAYIRSLSPPENQPAIRRTISTCWGSQCSAPACCRRASRCLPASSKHRLWVPRFNTSCRIRIAVDATATS
jgi:mono/diheme cytochrome c family protein